MNRHPYGMPKSQAVALPATMLVPDLYLNYKFGGRLLEQVVTGNACIQYGSAYVQVPALLSNLASYL